MREPGWLIREIYDRQMTPLARKVMVNEYSRFFRTNARSRRLALLAEDKRRKLARERKVWR